MATISISLPDSMQAFIEERVSEGGYTTTSDYFRELVLEDQKRKAQEKLEALLLEGLDSGESTAMTRHDWAEIRQAVHERIAQRDPV